MVKDSMKNKWDYSGVEHAYFSDAKGESYKKSAEFLDYKCEDWGCGTGRAKDYFKEYKGIDGSPSKFLKPEDTVDLVEYTSDVDNILMRQVLEVNTEWRKILENIKKSFRKKFCLVIYTPLVDKTREGGVFIPVKADGTPMKGKTLVEIYFNRQDILDYFPEKEFKVREEIIKTNQGYGSEWILYVERI